MLLRESIPQEVPTRRERFVGEETSRGRDGAPIPTSVSTPAPAAGLNRRPVGRIAEPPSGLELITGQELTSLVQLACHFWSDLQGTRSQVFTRCTPFARVGEALRRPV